MKILVTGTAGFIGYHLARTLAERGDEIVGLDSINDYYDVNLKYGRLDAAGVARDRISYNVPTASVAYPNYRFIMLNCEDRAAIEALFARERFDAVCHLAAQPGVRYSLRNPHAYIASNIVGFINVLDACRNFGVRHLVYASSSSVYGLNEKMPFSTSDNVDHPASLYGATKKSNELMAHSYSHLFALPCTGLRFFTVYGPWGRPDMAPMLFASAIMAGKPLDVYNHGKMQRDFTYVSDIVEGIVRVIDRPPKGNPEWSGQYPEPGSSRAPYRIYNIGNSAPVKLLDFIEIMERELGKPAIKNFLPLQPGDIPATYADVSDLVGEIGFSPTILIDEGIRRFVDWYRVYYSE